MVFDRKKPGNKKEESKAKKDKKTDKNRRELKKFAKFLSGKKVELRIKDKSISMYVDGKHLCGFTGKIMAEDYRKEKANVEKWETKLYKREQELEKKEEKLKESNGNLKKLQELAELDKKRQELIESINDC